MTSESEPSPLLTPEALAQAGLAVISPDWNVLGLGTTEFTCETGDAEALQQRVTALLLARCAAIASSSQPSSGETPHNGLDAAVAADPDDPKTRFNYKNFSTRTICKSATRKGWPPAITPGVIAELAEFVKRILTGYKEVPYHNRKHAYHVVLSTAKLMDMMIESGSRTYGLKYDPLALFAMVFAALCHDVEHQGIPNRQLAMEDDRLAILYNDQSMAEHWSLYVAFSDFLQDEFAQLRSSLFSQDIDPSTNQQEYRRFRKLVVNMVLCTDIASPERTQIGKSKWKEAFGDPFETVERKIREDRRLSMTGRMVIRRDRRGSAVSAMSLHPSEQLQNINGDDDDSLSGTPEHSETEGDGADGSRNNTNSGVNRAFISHPNTSGAKAKMERRMSSTSIQSSKYRQRLGILRTVDLSGETLETYERRGSMQTTSGQSTASSFTDSFNNNLTMLAALDEADDLKAAVIMENIMTAADVAHNLQGWDHMV